MKTILANPRGFCAGVVRAVEIVEQALLLYGAPIYVLHQIVHNQQVIQDLEARGVIFTEDMKSIPPRTVTVLSAHGVSDAVMETAKAQDLEIIDATCPLVTKVHLQAKRYSKSGHEVVIIGHRGHVEVEGTYGRVRGTVHVVGTVEDVQALVVSDPKRVSYVTQTTLSLDDTRSIVEALKDRFPEVKGPELSDICYATQNRQNAVRSLAEKVDVILVVGARNSSNSARLQEVGEMSGVDAYLIQDANEISPDWFANSSDIGVTAGASTPEILVQGVLDRLRSLGVNSIEEMEGVSEDITFKLPASLLREQKSL
ncbi:MAG: 4-hydroxy-3-methylbut-2-enyl diphosphate reductase [Nitrosomonadaceae bacterium]|nr:4-hydroxy-3-methylbut-2-enyl diphosphate reductase [Nitrosomonadaceae bacterium]